MIETLQPSSGAGSGGGGGGGEDGGGWPNGGGGGGLIGFIAQSIRGGWWLLRAADALVDVLDSRISTFCSHLSTRTQRNDTVVVVLGITLFTLLLPLLVPVVHRYVSRLIAMSTTPSPPFPFLSLPPELREMVYENLLEDPYYPPPKPEESQNPQPHLLSQLLPSFLSPQQQPGSPNHPSQKKKSTWIFLANKQIHAEYFNLLYKHRTLHLTVSQDNYTPPSSPSTPPQITPVTQPLWTLPQTALPQIRSLSLTLITNPPMLGVPDPHDMKPTTWPLAHTIAHALAPLQPTLKSFTLHVKAIGNPLWNPLWMWYHACQAFKAMGPPPSTPSQTPTALPGPHLDSITFSFMAPSPGENHLRRCPDADNAWFWYCPRGHRLGADGLEVPVREFCARLFTECRVCRPELESEDEGGE